MRKIVKLDYEAASMVFSESINDQSLSRLQIVFVKKVIDDIARSFYAVYKK